MKDNEVYLISFSDGFDVRDNLKTSCRIKTTGRFVQKENFGCSDQSTCSTNSSLLSTTDAFANGSSNDRVSLSNQAKSSDQSINSSLTLCLIQCTKSLLVLDAIVDEV